MLLTWLAQLHFRKWSCHVDNPLPGDRLQHERLRAALIARPRQGADAFSGGQESLGPCQERPELDCGLLAPLRQIERPLGLGCRHR